MFTHNVSLPSKKLGWEFHSWIDAPTYDDLNNQISAILRSVKSKTLLVERLDKMNDYIIKGEVYFFKNDKLVHRPYTKRILQTILTY